MYLRVAEGLNEQLRNGSNTSKESHSSAARAAPPVKRAVSFKGSGKDKSIYEMSGTSGSDVEIDLDSSSSEEEVVSEGEDFGANSDDSSDGGENTSEDDKEDHDDVVEDMSEPKKLTKEEPEEQMKVSKKLPNNCGIRPATNRSSAFKRASKRVMKPPVLKKPATQVAALQSPQVQSSPGLHQLDLDSVEDDPMPTAKDQAARREENIRAMLDGSLDVSRKPLLPKLLSVQDAAVVLRKPFKSPHPNAPARSEVHSNLKLCSLHP